MGCYIKFFDRFDLVVEELNPDRNRLVDGEDIQDIAPGGEFERLINLIDPTITEFHQTTLEIFKVVFAPFFEPEDARFEFSGVRKITE